MGRFHLDGLRKSLKNRKPRNALVAGLTLAIILAVSLIIVLPASGDPVLTITPITWNVIGLDSNDVNIGPSNYPVGVRVCNTGPDPATNVTATFAWDDGNDLYTGDSYINLRTGSLSSITHPGTFASGACTDFYFEASVVRDGPPAPVSYNKSRRYHIDIDSDEGVTATSPQPRELFVEYLISQSRNSTSNVYLDGNPVAAGGTMDLVVGNTYIIRLEASTATNGYEQIESFINFPNTIFQINSVATTYTADGGTDSLASSKLYADGCHWENDPDSPNYRSCLSTGKYGGTVIIDYNVTIIGGGGTTQTLTNLIYDFSGSSYHYNSDFAASFRIAEILSPANITKSFGPNTIAAGQTSTLTYTINNISSSSLNNLNFTDLPGTPGWPIGMNVDNTTVTYGGTTGPTSCGSPTATLTAGSPGASFSNITVAGSSTCTISISVISAVDGTYPDTTSNLFIDTLDTGSKAAATLVVSSTPPMTGYTCTTGTKTTLVQWDFDAVDGGTATNPGYSSRAGDVSALNTIATASPGTGTASLPTVGSPTSGANSWRITDGWQDVQSTPTHSTTPYFEFKVDTSNYSDVEIQASYDLEPQGDWANPGDNFWFVHTSPDDGASWTDMATGINATKGGWTLYNDVNGLDHVASGAATGTGTTTFRVNFQGSKDVGNPNPTVNLDDVTIVGCPRPTPPNLSKSFSPATIGSDRTDPAVDPTVNYTTLTFTIGNSNASALTGVAFVDMLPDGLVIANPPSVSGFTCNSGTMTGTVTATANSNTISLNGGSLPAGATATCSFSVRVQGKYPGTYTNTSNRIEADYAGVNTTGGANVGYGEDTLTVVSSPTISKGFADNTITTTSPTDTSQLTFTFSNPNSTSISNVNLTDNLPTGLVVATPNGLTSVICSPSSALTGETITANPGSSSITMTGATSMAANSVCSYSVNVTGTSTGLKTNTVTLTSSSGDDTATAQINVVNAVVDIRVSKEIGLSSSIDGSWLPNRTVTTGTPLYYRFVVENIGDVDFSSVDIYDSTLAGWLGIVPPTNPIPCSWYKIDPTDTTPPYTYVTTTGLPAASATADPIAYCVVGPVIAQAGTHPNTAMASGTYASGTKDSLNDTATYIGTGADLSIAKSDSPDPVLAGNQLTYTLTVNNAGPSDAVNVVVTDTLPAGVTYVSDTDACAEAPAGTLTCSLGGIAAAGSSSFDITVTVDADTPAGTITNTAVVSSDTSDPNGGNDNTTEDTEVAVLADLEILKTGPASAASGANVVYTIDVFNNGPSDAVNVVVTDPTPAELGFVSADPPCAGGFPCAVGTIVSGGSVSFNVTFSVPTGYSGPDPIVNVAAVSSDVPDPDPTNNDDSSSTPVDRVPEADLSVTKVGPPSAAIGSSITYMITVTNNGPDDARNVSLAESIPPGLVFVSADPPCAGGFPCALGTVNAGESVVINVTLHVPPAYTGPDPIVNTATVTSSTSDPVPGNNSDTKNTPIGLDTVDLTVIKTGPAQVAPGDDVTYQIEVSNSGPATATGVTFDDPTPAGLTFVSATAPCEGGFPCLLGALAPGGSTTVSVTFNVPLDYAGPDPIVNTATAAANEPDADPSDNSDDAATGVGAEAADLQVEKTGPSSVEVGGSLTFQIVVTNNGPGTATGIVLDDPTPAGLTFNSASAPCGGGFPCALTDLVNGSSVAVSVTFNVPLDYAGPDPIVNTATVSATTPDDDPTNDTDTAQVPIAVNADLSIAKTDSPDPVVAGNQLTYTVTVDNNGPSDAQNVVVTDTLPAGVTFVSTSGCAEDPNGVPTCSLGNIAASGSASFTITVNVDPSTSGVITNTAAVSSDTSDPNAANDLVTETTLVNTEADLAVTKDDGVASVDAGGTTTYTVRVTNVGPSSVTGAILSDPVAAGLSKTGVVCSGTPGECVTPPTVGQLEGGTFALPALASGEFYEIDVTVDVTAASGSVTNTATVAAPAGVGDPVPGNDSASDTDTVIIPSIIINDVTVQESDGVATFTVALSNPSSATITVDYATSDNTAVDGADYNATSNVLIFAPGETTKTIDVTILEDLIDEPAETFFVNLSNSTNSVIADAQGLGTILDNDPVPSIIINDVTVLESDGVATFTVALSNPSSSTITVDYATSDNTAIAGLDYVSTSNVLTFTPGETSKTVDVTILSDVIFELSETFFVNLSNPTNSTIADAQGVGTILDNAVAPGISKSFSPDSITLGSTSTLTINLSNSNPVAATLTSPFVDTLPANVVVAATPNIGGTCAGTVGASAGGSTITYASGSTIPPGGCTIEVDVSSTAVGTHTNTIDVGDLQTTLGNNTSPTSDDLVVLAATITDPAITKTGDPATAQVGDTVIFTLEVTNNGPAAATDVVVEDVLPTFLTFSSITAPGGAWTYDAPTNTVTITYATVLPGDLFTIVIRTVVNSLGSPPGGTNTASLTSDPLDRDLGNNDASAPITIVVVSDLRAPETGFTPGVQTEIPAQTAEKAYADYAELTLSIPALKVSAPIVGVPLDTDGWDVAWLWNRVGYLEGTAFPGWDGNSVLTSHVYLPNGLPGPFIGLKELQWGDRVILEAYSLRYIYEVRESRFYLPGDHRIIRHEESPWLTLVTCHSYDEATETYRWRRVVRAVLVSIDTT